MLSDHPRCTPPTPPVAKTSIPASRAQIMVAATVVAPVTPLATALPRSSLLSLAISIPDASRSRPPWSRPTRIVPSITAIVAGTPPPERTRDSASMAQLRLSGAGSPWLIKVLSRATTGRPSASAVFTSGAISNALAIFSAS